MFQYSQLKLFSDNKLNVFKGINRTILNMLSNKPYILYFISPEVNIKVDIIKHLINDYAFEIPKEMLVNLKLIALDFDPQAILRNIDDVLSENSLIKVYAYYAKVKSMPQWLLDKLLDCSKAKHVESRIIYLINALLSYYFLQDNNFDLADSHIKYCIEYINDNIDSNEYENMVSYVICGKYLENSADTFVSCASNYYALAADIAERIKDEISLAAIYNYLAYYYHNIEERIKSVEYSQKALSAAAKLNVPALDFNIYKVMSVINLAEGNYNSAYDFMRKSIKSSNDIENFPITESIKLKNSLGYIQYLSGNFNNAIEIHFDALKALSLAPTVSEILDEVVKTFDNLSTSFKMLGDINNSIHFVEATIKIIENCNYGNRINDIQNLCKQYTDLGLLYGLYYNDLVNALKYYNLAKTHISKNDHYIKQGNLIILQAYIRHASGFYNDSKSDFDKAMHIFITYGANNLFVQILILSYYIYFSKIFKDDRNELLHSALTISCNFRLNSHYNFFINFFIENKSFDPYYYDEKDFPLNLILLLSEERKRSLSESKKARHFEIIQDFSHKINLIPTEKRLFKEAQSLFNKYFLSKGFISIKHNIDGSFETNVELENSLNFDKTEIAKYLEGFIDNNNLILSSHGKSYDIFNFNIESSSLIKSMIMFYIYDEVNYTNYYFAIFYDKNHAWCFSNDDAEVGLILIKSLYFKLKNIHYTENIKKSSLYDHITGLFNVKYMWNKLNKLIVENSNGTAFSMALIDLNSFKQINDNFGHSIGDEVLKFFSKLLKVSMGANRDIIRYGGDEFVILFPGLNKIDAENLLLNLIELCKKQPYICNNDEIYISFSYGLESYNKSFHTSKSFFISVDKLMYLDKSKNKYHSHQ